MSDALRPVRLRADELTAPPVVGRTYLVPTVRHEWWGFTSAWPVMGPKHEDGEHLNFPYEHYHIDSRFLNDRQRRKVEWQYENIAANRGVGDVLALGVASAPLMTGHLHLPPLPAPVLRPLRCRSDQHAYPLGYSLKNTPHARMHETFAGRRCGRDAAGHLICPHKGFVLDSLVPDASGRVICPLHGLVVDVVSARVVAPETGAAAS